MPANDSNTPQGDDHGHDDDSLCPACGARFLPDPLALECDVCAAEDHAACVEEF